MCETKGVQIAHLDEYLVALAKYVLDPVALFDDDASQERCVAQRKDLCESAGVPIHKWSATSLRMYVNALAGAYKATGGKRTFVPSSTKQFPKWNAFMNQCGTRSHGGTMGGG